MTGKGLVVVFVCGVVLWLAFAWTLYQVTR